MCFFWLWSEFTWFCSHSPCAGYGLCREAPLLLHALCPSQSQRRRASPGGRRCRLVIWFVGWKPTVPLSRQSCWGLRGGGVLFWELFWHLLVGSRMLRAWMGSFPADLSLWSLQIWGKQNRRAEDLVERQARGWKVLVSPEGLTSSSPLSLTFHSQSSSPLLVWILWFSSFCFLLNNNIQEPAFIDNSVKHFTIILFIIHYTLWISTIVIIPSLQIRKPRHSETELLKITWPVSSRARIQTSVA